MHIVFVSREYVPTFRGGGIASYIKETAIGLVKKRPSGDGYLCI